MAALACRRDRFGAESAAAGSVSAGVASGHNSGEKDRLREGRDKVPRSFFGKVSRGTEILPYVRFGGSEFLVAGEDDVTVQDVLFVEVVGTVRVVEIVGGG